MSSKIDCLNILLSDIWYVQPFVATVWLGTTCKWIVTLLLLRNDKYPSSYSIKINNELLAKLVFQSIHCFQNLSYLLYKSLTFLIVLDDFVICGRSWFILCVSIGPYIITTGTRHDVAMTKVTQIPYIYNYGRLPFVMIKTCACDGNIWKMNGRLFDNGKHTRVSLSICTFFFKSVNW